MIYCLTGEQINGWYSAPQGTVQWNYPLRGKRIRRRTQSYRTFYRPFPGRYMEIEV